MSKAFTLVTGSDHKLEAWHRLLPADFKMESEAIDLSEIQSFDAQEIVRHKLHQAFDIVGGPVVVEDVSAGLDELNGLPGPFIKFFEQRLGAEALYILAGKKVVAATVVCTIGYYDGSTELLLDGVVHGTVGPPKGDGGFGFDSVFTPNGQTQTFAQMSPTTKDATSHRGQAARKLFAELGQL